MERSEQIGELAKALCEAQAEIKPAIKDSNNPFFKSKYADLAAVMDVCRGPLTKHGLAISQHPGSDGEYLEVETVLIHQSGQWIASKLRLKPVDTKPQSVGSAITYARRYSLSAVLGIASEEDDDGNKASGLKVERSQGGAQSYDAVAKQVAKERATPTVVKKTPEDMWNG